MDRPWNIRTDLHLNTIPLPTQRNVLEPPIRGSMIQSFDNFNEVRYFVNGIKLAIKPHNGQLPTQQQSYLMLLELKNLLNRIVTTPHARRPAEILNIATDIIKFYGYGEDTPRTFFLKIF